MTKRYDRAYFDKWYRSAKHRVHHRDEVRRKIALAVTLAEYFLRRPLRSAIDIGAGEGAWYPHLRALRRGIQYAGVDSSEYAVERFGRSRNIRMGTFQDLPSLRLKPADLLICSDVIHYLSEREIRSGLPELVRLTGGLAYLEILTAEDNIVGDLHGLTQRPSDYYRRSFSRAGLLQVGPYCWLSPRLAAQASRLESFTTS